MKRLGHAILSFFFFLACVPVMSTASFSATPIDTSLAPMLQKVLPAVVSVKALIKVTDFETLREIQKQRRSKGAEGEQALPGTFTSVASGVIVDAQKGYILTNAHVINDAQSVTVTLSDGRHYTGKIIGLDKPSDIALLQIKAKNLIAVPIADSNKLKVGDFVAAIGNPFGLLNQTVTSGIVSALGRTTLGIEGYENFIQTDAPINPGNSGGALINMQGELVGINTAILSPDRGSIGIGFAIPVNMAKSVMDQLIEYGNVKRGVLGIGAQDITPELANAFNLEIEKGAAVTQVLPDSPAQQAGIEIGDIITAVNGSPIKNASDVVNTIGFLRVDSKTNIDIIRHKKHMTINVQLSDPKKRKQFIERANPFLYGVGLKDFSLLSPIHGNVLGVLVVSVEQDSNAWHSDLRAGDVITSVNQQKVKNIDELKMAVAKTDKPLLLNVLRGPSAIFLVINKEEA
ncbi:Do family serine endopeptidase [Aquicella lusitana]|uniref:Serine protease Do n=1 Tax=Aquicella lusitana TaxID=254246 RepID=A0A370GYR1_9COXI|nr:Do family serine endopeptidase [Aquicella lusitana]RDI48793.1 serine protease Do [Aquicella lusitana]VVC73221.1 Periplasmic pH-dependent serine endoprotease DegQ [Aquicella lusitana]